jgi:hypothetical protein
MYNTFLLSIMDGGFEQVQSDDWKETTWPYHGAHTPDPISFLASTALERFTTCFLFPCCSAVTDIPKSTI